ncbi:MAG: NYN domain-containing protein [Chloroflexi bacterium]|nr:NYN domain-containing protein [Chloroflexota bacterium]
MKQLIIDGYNVLRCNPQLTALEKHGLESARYRLVNLLAQKSQQYDITVVFDGYQSGFLAERTERIQGIRVTYSGQGEKADEVIKRLIDGLAQPANAIVVSNDNEIRQHAHGRGCQVGSADALTPPPRRRITPATLAEDEESQRGKPKKGPSWRRKRRQAAERWRF